MTKYFMAVLGLTALVSGCVTTNENPNSSGAPIRTPMLISPRLPAAEAKLDITPTTGTSSLIQLQIRGLTAPGRVVRGAQVYIVWEAPTGLGGKPQPQSLGALRLERNLSSQLKTVTPFRSFELFITAEANAKATQPTGEHLVWSTVSR